MKKRGKTVARIRLSTRGFGKYRRWLEALNALIACQPDLEIVATVKNGKSKAQDT